MSKRSVSIMFLQVLIDYLAKQPIDIKGFLAPHKITTSLLQDREHRVEADTYNALYQDAASLLEDPLLGFRVGTHMQPRFLGVVGYAMMSTKSLRDALNIHMRYQQLVGTFGDAVFQPEKYGLRIYWKANKNASYHIAEKSMATWVTFGRWITQSEASPLEICFSHSANVHSSDGLKKLNSFFGCPLLFEQPETAIFLSDKLLDLPVTQHDEYLYQLMRSKAENALAQFQSSNKQLMEFQSIVIDLLLSGNATVEALSGKLSISVRQVQRKLRELNTSFSDLLDKTRKELVERMLLDQSMTLVDIAFSLGFSEQSSFQRAFKRWYTKTPGQYRKELESNHEK